MSTSIPDKYKVDHLFVLIGENPLPNYVAAKTLLKEGGTVYLVHSTDTTSKANCLERMLKPVKVQLVSLDRNEAKSGYIQDKIKTRVKKILEKPPAPSFGLNYTGGTKAMAVHSYRSLLEASGVHNPIFSYLDARSLKMLIDRDNDSPASERVEIQLSLQEIFELHELHWEQDPVIEPKLPNLALEFAKFHTDISLVIAWRWWCDHVLKPATKVLKKKSNLRFEWEWKKDIDLAHIAFSPDLAIYNLDKALKDYHKQLEDGKSFSDFFQDEDYKNLKEICGLYNTLWKTDYTAYIEKITQIFKEKQYLSASELKLSLRQFAEKCQFEKTKHACEWLDGLWLEHYVLHQVQEVDRRYPGLIHDNGMSFKVKHAKKEKFEFDVAFTKDYQLFALSCTTDASKNLCKSKLFEAYIRARQLGGDQARTALVCCYDKPEELEAELKVETAVAKEDPKLVVFGCKQLDNLQIHIKHWIDKNNIYYTL